MTEAQIVFQTVDSQDISDGTIQSGQRFGLAVDLEVQSSIAFDLDAIVEWRQPDTGELLYQRYLGQDGWVVSWLPQGRYRLQWLTPSLNLPQGQVELVVSFSQLRRGVSHPIHEQRLPVTVTGDAHGQDINAAWDLESLPGTQSVAELGWRQGLDNWFFRHFGHAADTITSYMLGNSPLLKGRVLDVGCGDGITDLGICLRWQPEMMVGVDPFKGFERLPQILADNHLDASIVPDNLTFKAADGNHLPFPDDSFDVVLSWGSLEHIAGGYLQTMREIKRVLKDGGLLFAHPGLYYSNYGHHIGEFTDEPFVHLTRSEAELKDIVLNTPPNYMDRSGEFSPPEQYWQWYKELNPITVAEFERELRTMEFDFYRVALRTEDMIEYHHPSLQAYSMQDLATVELYLSAYNRKQTRPQGLVNETL